MGGLGLVGSRELRARGPCQIQPPLASGLLKMPVISSNGCDSVTLRGSKLPQKLLGTRFTFFRLKLLIINSLPSLLPGFLSGLSYFEGQTLPLSSGSLFQPLSTDVGRASLGVSFPLRGYRQLGQCVL